jgi:hypothetical protein
MPRRQSISSRQQANGLTKFFIYATLSLPGWLRLRETQVAPEIKPVEPEPDNAGGGRAHNFVARIDNGKLTTEDCQSIIVHY